MNVSVALLLTLLGVAPSVKGPGVYKSPAGRFSVQFPCGKPLISQRSVVSDLGELTVHSVRSSNASDTRSFVVSYTDYPADRVKRRQLELIRSAVDGMVGDESRLRGDVELRAGKTLGRELTFERGRYLVYARLVLVGSRLYQLMVIGPAAANLESEARSFFKSFKPDVSPAAHRPAR